MASKYRATACQIDGIRFASQKEGRRYAELKLMLKSRLIADLKLQPKIDLCIAPYGKVCSYIADFFYTEKGQPVYEDVKGFKTPIYKLKKKLVKALLNIEIRET